MHTYTHSYLYTQTFAPIYTHTNIILWKRTLYHSLIQSVKRTISQVIHSSSHWTSCPHILFITPLLTPLFKNFPVALTISPALLPSCPPCHKLTHYVKIYPSLYPFLHKSIYHHSLVDAIIPSLAPSVSHKSLILSTHTHTKSHPYSERAICLMFSTLLGFRMLHNWNNSKDSWILPSCLRMSPLREKLIT